MASDVKDGVFKAGFDHPCRETCSGWRQGYERGHYSALNSPGVAALIKRATHMRHVLLASHILADERSPQKQAAREFDEALAAFEAAKGGVK